MKTLNKMLTALNTFTSPVHWRKHRAVELSYLAPVSADRIKEKTLIIIVVHKYVKRLETLVSSIRGHKEHSPYDIIVVNNNSDAHIRKFLLGNRINFFERCNEYQNNGGWNAAILRHPDYRYYLCLDDDTYVVRDNWLSSYIKIAADDTIGCVGNYYCAMKTFYHLGHDKLERTLKLNLAKNGLLDSLDDSVDHVQSSAVMLKNTVLCNHGLWQMFMPNNKFSTVLSEVEMSVRLRKKKYVIGALPEVSFGHRNYKYETLPAEYVEQLDSYATHHGI